MKVLPVVLLLTLMLAPLDAELAEVVCGGNSVTNAYCTLTYDGNEIVFADTKGCAGGLMIALMSDEDTDITLHGPESSVTVRAEADWGMCVAVFDGIMPGKYSVSCDAEVMQMSMTSSDGIRSAAWSSD
ncbi:MAG: hypothetical protein E7Z65_08075 [Thermoplasmata archaeon]|nr:hypothetical protein [Thermoplasmata archaeon]